MQKYYLVLRSTAGCLLQFGLEIFYKNLNLLRVYGDDVMGTLEMASNFFKRHRTAVGGNRAHHCVEFALFLVVSSGQSCEELCTAASVNKVNYINESSCIIVIVKIRCSGSSMI